METITDTAEADRVFDFRLNRVFFSVREIARQRHISPAAVHAYFDVGGIAGQVVRTVNRGERGIYPDDLSLEQALAEIGEYASENSISPLEVIRRFEIGGGAVDNFDHLTDQDHGGAWMNFRRSTARHR